MTTKKSRLLKFINVLSASIVFFFIVTCAWFIWEQSQPGSPVEKTLEDMDSLNQEEIVEKLKEDFGFDKPVHVRYFDWLKRKVTPQKDKTNDL